MICADTSPLAKCKDPADSAKSADEDSAHSAATIGSPDVSHLLRLKFNKFQNGFRKRRALSVHESLSEKDRNHATFYVPTPLSRSSDDVEHGDDLEAVSLPPTVLNRIPCARINYRKSPSECSSGRGTVTPTEEFDNDSSGSNQSSKSNYYRKYSYDDKVKENDKNGYWDQGYHSIEYSPVADNIYRFNSYSCKNRYDDRNGIFRDTSNLPSTIRSSKSENVPTSKFINSPNRTANAKLPMYYDYRTPDRRNRASLCYERSNTSPDCISINVKLSGNECTNFAPRKIANDSRYAERSRTPSSCDRRKLMNISDPLAEDDFDEHLILRNEPKTRSCRRWSQADTLAIESATAGKSYPQNGFRIGDRVTVDMYVGCQLPYAALQSIEPMSMPYNLSPPIPAPKNDKQFNKLPNLRRRSARSVSPESRKKETEAREKRQQIVQNLQKYVDQRRKGIVGSCKSNADLTSVSENDGWKKEENDKVIVICIPNERGLTTERC